MEHLFDLIVAKANYWSYIILMMIGIYAMIAKRNLIKKIIGMSIVSSTKYIRNLKCLTTDATVFGKIIHMVKAIHTSTICLVIFDVRQL